jgi:flavin reductase (DIM6/NTAB) family NADH-FMN oxidoreductase RutF
MMQNTALLDTLEVGAIAGAFVVSVLASDQDHLADRFATKARPSRAAQFTGVPHHSGDYGPIIEKTVASLGCRLHAAHPYAHHIVIGEVASVEASPGRPALLRHAGTRAELGRTPC